MAQDDFDLDPDHPNVNFSGSYLPNSPLVDVVDRVQRNGRWVPAFGPPSLKDEEEYIRRMIARDEELNWG